MSRIYEEDILKAGENQLIISNDLIKAIVIPQPGGRIADIESGDAKYLYRTYPEGVTFGPYTEYGGIEECIGGAPGTLWNAHWKWEKQDDNILLRALSRGILVQKSISLLENKPIVKIDYSFFNMGNNFSKFTFGIHPEICVGGTLPENRYHIPASREMVTGENPEPGFKDKIVPSEGWCAITCNGKVFGQMFPEDTIDVVEIYYPRVNTHMVLEPLIYGVGLSPDRCARFTYMVYAGDGEAEKIREIRNTLKTDFVASYEDFDRNEIPENVLAELEDVAQVNIEQGPVAIVGFMRGPFPQMPGIPEIKIPDMGKFFVKTDKTINVVTKTSPDQSETAGRTEDLPPNTEIRIENLRGNATIRGWGNNYVEYDNVRGGIDLKDGMMQIRTSGDCSLKVPRDTPGISLDLVDGNTSVFDTASSLKISGVNGNVDIIAAEVPDNSVMDISLVKGNINLAIPDDSSCSIHATTMGGEIFTSDLTFQKSAGDKNQLSAVMNEGKASINLRTVRGNISISGRTMGQ